MTAAADRAARAEDDDWRTELEGPRGSNSDVSGIASGTRASSELPVAARMDLARQALEQGRPHHALLHLEAVEDAEPDWPGLDKSYGQALLGVGMVAEALERFERAVKVDPDDVGSWRLVGALREERGDHVGAMDACMRAVLLTPEGWTTTGPRPADARRSSDRAPATPSSVPPSGTNRTSAPPEKSPAQVLRLAEALLEAGSVLNAEKLFARHLQSPLAAQAYLGLARCACARGNASQALPHLRAAQRLAPGHPDLRAAIQALLAAIAR